MEEKILIEGTNSKGKYLIYATGVALILAGILFVYGASHRTVYLAGYGYIYNRVTIQYVLGIMFGTVAVILGIVTALIYWMVGRSAIRITNSKIYGKCARGERCQISINEVYSLKRINLCNGFEIETFGGKYQFFFIDNDVNVVDSILYAISESGSELSKKECVVEMVDVKNKYTAIGLGLALGIGVLLVIMYNIMTRYGVWI